jgi:hypothetical protein
MKKIIICVLLAALSNIAPAGEKEGPILRLYPSGDYVYFRLKDDTCNSTANNEFYYFNMTENHHAAKNWYSMILAAGSTGKPVKVQVSNCNLAGNKKVTYVFQDF